MRPLQRRILGFSAFAFLAASIGIALFLLPVLACGCSQGTARRADLSDLKHLALGHLFYAADHDDRFVRRDFWMDDIRPYVQTDRPADRPGDVRTEAGAARESFFHWPGAKKGECGFAFNSKLSTTEVPKSPERVPLVYDSRNANKNASDPVTSLPSPGRWAGRNNIAYADGVARSVPVFGVP